MMRCASQKARKLSGTAPPPGKVADGEGGLGGEDTAVAPAVHECVYVCKNASCTNVCKCMWGGEGGL